MNQQWDGRVEPGRAANNAGVTHNEILLLDYLIYFKVTLSSFKLSIRFAYSLKRVW